MVTKKKKLTLFSTLPITKQNHLPSLWEGMNLNVFWTGSLWMWPICALGGCQESQRYWLNCWNSCYIVVEENYLETLRKGFMSDNKYLSKAEKIPDGACLRKSTGYNSSFHFAAVQIRCLILPNRQKKTGVFFCGSEPIFQWWIWYKHLNVLKFTMS